MMHYGCPKGNGELRLIGRPLSKTNWVTVGYYCTRCNFISFVPGTEDSPAVEYHDELNEFGFHAVLLPKDCPARQYRQIRKTWPWRQIAPKVRGQA